MTEATLSPDLGGGDRQFLTFLLNDRLYALPAEDVEEVIRTPPVARMPYAPAALIGLANLRGSVVPLVSLRNLLELNDSASQGSRSILLGGASPAALAVDTVETMVTVTARQVETRRAELAADDGEKVLGAFEIAGRGPAKILDMRALLDRAFVHRGGRLRQIVQRSSTPGPRRLTPAKTESETLVTFDVAEQEYALPLWAVLEIVTPPQTVTQTPRTERLVLGIMPYREQLLPLFSLRGLLGFESAALPDGREKVVVIAVRGCLAGLVVDRARAIVSAEYRLTEAVPAILAARMAGEARLKAIYRGDGGRRLISVLAPEQLFREDVMRRLASVEGPSLQHPVEAPILESQVLIFQLGQAEFGLPVEVVDEVTRVPDQITRVPRAPAFLEGVINLRGEVLPVLDQRRRFDMPHQSGAGRRLIVVRTDKHRAGLIVDSVSEVRRLPADAIERPPILSDDIARSVQGVINLPEQGRIVLLLDPVELLTRAEHGLLDAFEEKTKAET